MLHRNLWVGLIFSLLICSSAIGGDYGKYAILTFRGTETEMDDDSTYVYFEMAPMFGALLDEYDFANSNIYVHNQTGDSTSGMNYYAAFKNYASSVENYRPSETDTADGIRKTFRDLNTALNSNDKNVVLIYMCGHGGKSM